MEIEDYYLFGTISSTKKRKTVFWEFFPFTFSQCSGVSKSAAVFAFSNEYANTSHYRFNTTDKLNK